MCINNNRNGNNNININHKNNKAFKIMKEANEKYLDDLIELYIQTGDMHIENQISYRITRLALSNQIGVKDIKNYYKKIIFEIYQDEKKSKSERQRLNSRYHRPRNY